MRYFYTISILFLWMGAFFSSCGSTGGSAAPPVSIPAPTIANITVSSPDEEGNVLVVGAAGSVEAGTTVEIYIEESLETSQYFVFRKSFALEGPFCNVVANDDGSFECEVPASEDASLCIKQKGTSESSECGSKSVPRGAVAHKLFDIKGIALDQANSHTVILGQRQDSVYLIKIIDNETKTLISSVNLNETFQGLENVNLRSLAAHNGRILIVDNTNTRLLELKPDFSATIDAGNCTELSEVVIDPVAIDNEHKAFLICKAGETGNGDPQVKFIALNEDASVYDIENFPFPNLASQISSVNSVTYAGDHRFIATFALSNGVTVLSRTKIRPNNQTILKTFFVVAGNGNFVSHSAGEVDLGVIRVLAYETEEKNPYAFDVNFANSILLQTVTSDSENGIDAYTSPICALENDCTQIWSIDPLEQKITKLSFTKDNIEVLEERDIEILGAKRMILDFNLNRVVVIDPVGKTVRFIDLD